MNPRRSEWDIETKEYEYDAFIKSTSEKYGLDYTKFRQQLYQESRFNPNAVSRAGAIGIGQIMPSTAKAYGYKDISKLKDPYLNIDLAGQIMKDNLKYSKGNLYGALAMYNGGTKAMKKYLEGNFKDMPKETWDYLDILGDGDQWGGKKYDADNIINGAEQKSFVETPPEISELTVPEPTIPTTPFTQDPVNEDAVRGAHLSTTLSTELGLRFRSRRWADPRGVYNPAEDEANEPNVGFLGGLSNSWFVTGAKMHLADENLFGNQFQPTKEEGDYVLKKVGYNMDRYFAVLNGASSMKDVEERIKITDEHLKYLQAESNADFFDSLLSGVGSAVSDPLSYIPVGGANLAGRVLLGASMGVASNQLDTYVSGAEHDLMTDMIIGAGFGAGIEFGFKALGKGGHYVGDTARRAYIIREYQEAGKDLPSEMFEGIGGSTKLAKSLYNLTDNIDKRFPSFLLSTKDIFKRLETKDFREFTESFFVDRGSGYIDENGVHYATRFQGQTAEEKLRAAQIDFDNFEVNYRDHYNNLRKLGHQDDEINLAIWQAIENDRIPSKFVGNEEFTNIVESTKDFLQKTSKTGQRGGYMPRVSDPIKVADVFDPSIPRGIQVERLVNELSQALVDGVTGNEKIKQRIIDYYKKNVYAGKKAEREALIKDQQKKYNKYKPKNVQILKPLPDEPEWSEVFEWMKKEARDDALGWIDQGASQGRKIINDSNITSVQYNPEVTRIPWDTSVTTRSGLSIDKLRRDPIESIRMHQNKVVGESIIQSYGCNNLDEFEDMLGKMWSEELNTTVGSRVSASDFAQAKDQLINMIYNKYSSRSDVNSSWLGAMADSIRNLTFFSKNALMGVANLFEQGEAIKHYGAMHFFKGVPLVREMFDNWTNKGMTNKEVRQAQSLIFGMSVRNTGILRDIATESWDKQLRRFNGDKGKSILVATTDIIAQASPFTKFLQNTENSIVEASQGMFLGELIHYAHNRSISKKGFFGKELMQRNGISNENYENLLKILKSATEIDENKAIKITNLETILSKDPAALATLRRMGDYVAHEVIQKNSLGDTFLWEGSKKNPLMQLLLQFKSFAIRSYDKRLKKMMGRAAEGDALGQAYSLFLSVTLGTLGALTNTFIATAGMNDEQRKEYLKKTLKYDPNEGLTSDTLMQVGINGVMRSSVLAFPSLILNTAGVNTNVKTTTEGFDYQKAGSDMYKGFSVDKWARDLAPAYSTIKSFMDIAGYSANVVKMSGDENFTEEEKERNRERAVKAIRNATNIPFLKWGLYNILSNEED